MTIDLAYDSGVLRRCVGDMSATDRAMTRTVTKSGSPAVANRPASTMTPRLNRLKPAPRHHRGCGERVGQG